jgi:hypothetical protein
MANPARPGRDRKSVQRGPGKRIVEGGSIRLADEVRYIQQRAANHDGRIVTIGQLVLFSTETGDAWLLDRTDLLAARLAQNGEAATIQIVETAATFAIEWDGQLSHQWAGVRLFGSGYRSRHLHPRVPNRQTRWHQIARQTLNTDPGGKFQICLASFGAKLLQTG